MNTFILYQIPHNVNISFIKPMNCILPYAGLHTDSPPPSALWRVSGRSWLPLEALNHSVYNSLTALPSEVEWQTQGSWHGPSRRTQFLHCIKKYKPHAGSTNEQRKEGERAKHQISLKPYSWSFHLGGDRISTRLSLNGGDRSSMKERESFSSRLSWWRHALQNVA